MEGVPKQVMSKNIQEVQLGYTCTSTCTSKNGNLIFERKANHTYNSNINQEVIKQCPHVATGIYFLHLNFCVNVTVIQKIDICCLHLKIKNIFVKVKLLMPPPIAVLTQASVNEIFTFLQLYLKLASACYIYNDKA